MDSDVEIATSRGAIALREEQAAVGASLEELYDLHARALFRYAVAVVGNAEDAEDAVQEVFTRVARESKRLARIRDVRAYLFTATRNAAYTILRKRRRRRETDYAKLADIESDADGEAQRSIDASVLRQTFVGLPVEQREVLALKVFEEMTFQEIALAVGASINTIASRYRYAVAKLRQVLEDEDERRTS